MFAPPAAPTPLQPRHNSPVVFWELSAISSDLTPGVVRGSDKKIFNERESNSISQQRGTEEEGRESQSPASKEKWKPWIKAVHPKISPKKKKKRGKQTDLTPNHPAVRLRSLPCTDNWQRQCYAVCSLLASTNITLLVPKYFINPLLWLTEQFNLLQRNDLQNK